MFKQILKNFVVRRPYHITSGNVIPNKGNGEFKFLNIDNLQLLKAVGRVSSVITVSGGVAYGATHMVRKEVQDGVKQLESRFDRLEQRFETRSGKSEDASLSSQRTWTI
ncbi:unnamed protein product [Rhizophagus irregularis]|uniref:Uncharacterized protein n=1 Tax=Rhizophagus irregularis TaxID=588596 RepID=A0A2I1GU65_9GLOM|nr:hypothetical protein RhiirA4_466346 [Rhizophagus irregularis]CAB4444817.1 unnamed protein product [Rhizophagus irregularis]